MGAERGTRTMSLQVILACVICFAITAVAGKLLIPELVKLKAGQSIKEIGPTWHMTKQGTPTMGGLMFIIGIGLTIVALGWQRMMAGSFVHLYVYLFALVFGVIGYIDDYQKVKHHQNTGLTAPQKFILQLAAAVAFLCLMRYEGMLSPNLYIPFWNTHLVLPWVVYMIFAAFVFDIPIRGSLILLLAVSALFLIVALGLGLVISTATKNQFLACQFAIMGTFMPALMLSGFLYDILNMPPAVRAITYIIPARYYVTLLQTLFLAGDIPSVIIPCCITLGVFAVVLMGIARLKAPKSLE